MNKILLLLISIFIITSCDNQSLYPKEKNISWVFVANEGDMGSSNGSISMIDEFGNVIETESLGEVVQSIEVYGNKLIVLINGGQNEFPEDSKIKIFNITHEGLSMPGIEVSTNNSSPREMIIVDGMVYFTNWNTSDVKVFNLTTYIIDASIPVGVDPEGIIFDNNKLWVANSGENTVSEIDINTFIETKHNVGPGPQKLIAHNNDIYVSRTYYSDDWTTAYHGSSKISSEILINDYGVGVACGGSILTYEDNIYRSFNGGLARMDANLNLDENIIGNYNQSDIYHIEEINNNIWFAITDYNSLNEVHVIDFEGNSIGHYNVGQTPGDFAVWKK